jgi:hypothetical protein
MSGVSSSRSALLSSQRLQTQRAAEQRKGEEVRETSAEAQREIAMDTLRASMDQQQQQAQSLLQMQQTGRIDIYA